MSVRFSKAAAQQARLKVSMYGPPGSGKTFTALLFAEGLAKVRGKRIAFVDTERGTDFYTMAIPQRTVHPAAFDFDAVYTRSLGDTVEAIKSLDPATHGVLVIDSISHVWDSAIEAAESRFNNGKPLELRHWGPAKKPYRSLLSWVIDSPFDLFVLGRQKNLFETVNGELQRVGVSMRAEGETQYETHICMRMESRKDPTDSTKSIYEVYVEKDRTGVLSGKVFRNPSFSTIEPLLPLLGEVQAPTEDESERIAKDGELLQKQEDKAKDKAEKSLTKFRALKAEIVAAASIEDVASFATTMKKETRYLLDEHIEVLRQLYSDKSTEVKDKLAPKEVA